MLAHLDGPLCQHKAQHTAANSENTFLRARGVEVSVFSALTPLAGMRKMEGGGT